MANPAPTINQINAFNATQGTTIDFNIIGGTELVRSNRIYIYDLSDNSLICTHLYVSTESIHELPSNTDSSIVYESGKSSADFVNGAQYYAQIQTFTDIAGTEGGSGLSVAKMFWCLIDPTLTITTIPSTISTTSYNVSATYNANTSVVSNIIQQYQFNLYSATGSLLQSSGVVVGSGAQQGTSTTYDISYNFTGLSVGSSYYVVVDVTTTQGMNVSAQSNTFTVSIDTPTLGEATVVNNACDGYISVTSNLSSEYGGSASGEIASFVTSSINNVSSLKVSLEPIQDLHGYDKPWVGGAGVNLFPYLSARTATFNGVTFSCDGKGTLTMQGTATANDYITLTFPQAFVIPDGADYKFCMLNTESRKDSVFRFMNGSTIVDSWSPNPANREATYAGMSGKTVTGIRLYCVQGETYNLTMKPMFVPKSTTVTGYIPYSNICPISGYDEVNVSVCGVNLLNSESPTVVNAYLGSTMMKANANNRTVVMAVKPNTQYTYKWNRVNISSSADDSNIMLFDEYPTADVTVGALTGNNMSSGGVRTFTTTSTTKYIAIKIANITATDFQSTLEASQLELGASSTEHEAFNGTTYTTNLNDTVYGGTVDLLSGVLTVDKKMVTLDGSSDEPWAKNVGYGGYRLGILSDANIDGIPSQQLLSDKFIGSNQRGAFDKTAGKLLTYSANTGADAQYVFFVTDVDTLDAWRTWLSDNPTQLVYPLANPQTYQLTPQQIQTLLGRNNVWSEQGDVELAYHIPITNLLVKRQDVDDVSGTWLTLHSQPITQASDMNFTFIDFTNQYGKTYKYALVPLLTQTQSGVEVEVEGGYTVSDEVQSIFDGVFIADLTGSQKCKANVGYGNVDMNQVVGSITPIGAKYPIIITNSQNQYHNGSISGTIVPDDYYFNGNLSRIDMVNKRNELEQFLTNKRAKIIKDWNGNIWLAMIMDNVSCTFNNNYGMGIVNFSTNWIEVGDPTNQQDLQATGLIDVGGA